MRYLRFIVLGLLVLVGCTTVKYHYGTGYYAPCWNADGTRIYYFRNDLTVKEYRRFPEASHYEYEKNEWYICSCKPDGSDRRVVAKVLEFKGENPYPPQFWKGKIHLDYSPISNMIIYNLTLADHKGIWALSPDGTENMKISDTGRSPCWAPNGEKIVYAEEEGGIWIMDKNGENKQLFTQNGWTPTWSPGGKRIAFSELYDGFLQIISLDKTDTFKIAEKGCSPVWSPDGKKIAYWKYGQAGLFINTAEGNNESKVTEKYAEALAWYPSSKIVADGGGSIWIINTDGTGEKIILKGNSPYN